MATWQIVVIVVVVVFVLLWVVMECDPHHRFIDACGNPDSDRVKELLRLKPKLDKTGWFGLTPVGEAIRSGQIENVKLLIEAGASIKIAGARQSHLHTTVQENQVEAARLLLSHGADANELNWVFENPLTLATQLLNVEMCKLLVESGADPNCLVQNPNSPDEPLIIYVAAQAAKNLKDEQIDQLIQIVELLLDSGVSPETRSHAGAPLIVLGLSHPRLLKFMLDRGLSPDVVWEGKNLKGTIENMASSE